jgi:nucleoside-diphosphate-sugar epimerase
MQRERFVVVRVPVREIAEAIGRHLNLPARALPAGEYEGMLVPLLSTDMAASSTITQELMGWKPTHPGLIEDIEQGHYFNSGGGEPGAGA